MGVVGGKRENGFRRVRRGVGGGFGASSRPRRDLGWDLGGWLAVAAADGLGGLSGG